MQILTQLGHNPKFPEKAEVWRHGVDPVPEWLSDMARIKEIDSEGNPILDTRDCNTGEIEIIDSSGREVLIRLKGKDSVLLYSDTHPLITLTSHQLELLYKIKKNRS